MRILLPNSGALRIALVYVAVGILWITFSDQALVHLIGDRDVAIWLSLGKGYCYVLVTGALLHIAITRLHTQQRRTQLRLARSERAYRTMFDDNPNPMLVYDPHTLQFLAVNRAAETKYGYSRTEFLQKTLRDIHPPNTHRQLQRELDASEHSSDVLVLSPVVHQTSAGRRIDMEVTISALRMHARGAQLMMAQDISQRARAERELLESREQLKEAQRIAGFGSWSIDHDSGAVTVSEQMQHLLGLDRDTKIKTLPIMFKFVHPDDRAGLQNAYDNAWRGESLHIELRLLRSSGDIYHVLMRGEQVADGEGRRQLVGTILDIDERKRYEKKLQASERQYRQLIDNLPEAVLIYRDREIIFANPVAAELLAAANLTALRGANIDSLVAASSQNELRTRREWLLVGPEHADSQFRERLMRKLDGEIFEAEVAARSIMLDGAHCVQLLVRDISAQKKSQQELRQANERLLHLSTHMVEVADNERRQLSRELHDDLGQSLTFIKMTTAWLHKRLRNEEFGERVGLLYRAAGEALEKVRDLSQSLRPAQLDTRGLKAALEEHLHKFCEGGNISYKVEVEDLQPRPDPEIETALFRIFQEALTNIFRHSAASFIEIGLERKTGKIALRVVDDGHGFDVAEALARGGNLGLHTMQERAQQLGGGVQWQSVIGAGTEITATIPERPV